MQAFEVRFHTALLELIRQERIKEAQFLVDGKAADWADYKLRVGILEGLNRARDLSKKLADEAAIPEREEWRPA